MWLVKDDFMWPFWLTMAVMAVLVVIVRWILCGCSNSWVCNLQSPVSFPFVLACWKLAMKIVNGSHVTAGCCTVVIRSQLWIVIVEMLQWLQLSSVPMSSVIITLVVVVQWRRRACFCYTQALSALHFPPVEYFVAIFPPRTFLDFINCSNMYLLIIDWLIWFDLCGGSSHPSNSKQLTMY